MVETPAIAPLPVCLFLAAAPATLMGKVEAVEALDALQGRDLALVRGDVPGQQIRDEGPHGHRRSEARLDDTVEFGVADSGEVLVGGLVNRRGVLTKEVDVERDGPVRLHAPL